MADPDDDRFGRGGQVPTGAVMDSAPIGVPAGYQAATPSNVHRGMSAYEAGASPEGLPPHMVSARYFDGDQYMPSRFSPQQIFELQQELGRIGLLRGSFQKGIWDEPTANAYAAVLAYANQQGLTERAALLKLTTVGPDGIGERFSVDENGKIVPAGAEGRPPLVTRTTDPKVLKNVFRRSILDLTGVGWDETKVNDLASAYNQMEMQRQQQAYDMAETGGNVVDIPSPEAFIDTQLREQHPEKVQKYQAMQYASEAAQLLSDTAWGIG